MSWCAVRAKAAAGAVCICPGPAAGALLLSQLLVSMFVSRPPSSVSAPVNLLHTRPLTYRYDCSRLNMYSSRRSSSTHTPSKRNLLTLSPR